MAFIDDDDIEELWREPRVVDNGRGSRRDGRRSLGFSILGTVGKGSSFRIVYIRWIVEMTTCASGETKTSSGAGRCRVQ